MFLAFNQHKRKILVMMIINLYFGQIMFPLEDIDYKSTYNDWTEVRFAKAFTPILEIRLLFNNLW